jgi:hypothetical protein
MPQKAPRPVGWEPDGAGFGFSLGGGNEASLIQNPHHAQALSRLRRQRLAERVHRLGPRVLFELIDEIVRHHGLAYEKDVTVVFEQIAVTEQLIHDLSLPTREPKRNTSADKKWPFDFACERDAIPPDYMRALVQAAIERHFPADRFEILKAAEASERTVIRQLVEGLGAPA